MKKRTKRLILILSNVIIFVLAIVLVKSCNAQHFNMGVGIGFNTVDAPVINWNSGVNMGRFNLDGFLNEGATGSSTTNGYFGGKFGINLFSENETEFTGIAIIPAFNYAYDLVKWNDNKIHPRNKWVSGYSLRLIKYNRDNSNMGWYIDGMYINKSYQITFGIHGNKLFNL